MRRLALALLLLPSIARANCPTLPANIVNLQPGDGGTDVPVNGVVNFGTQPVFGSYSPVVTLSTGGAGAVSGALVAGPAGSWTFRPDTQLLPSTAYQVSITDANGVGAPANGAFTTGTSLDVTDPAELTAPTLTLQEYVLPVRDGTCLHPGYYHVLATWPPAVDEHPVMYAVDLQVLDLTPGDFTGGAVPYDEVIGTPITALTTSAVLNVPDYSEATVSIYTIDEAGRQDHSLAGVLVTPQAPSGGRGTHGCGCDLTPDEGRESAFLGMGIATAILILAESWMRVRSRSR